MEAFITKGMKTQITLNKYFSRENSLLTADGIAYCVNLHIKVLRKSAKTKYSYSLNSLQKRSPVVTLTTQIKSGREGPIFYIRKSHNVEEKTSTTDYQLQQSKNVKLFKEPQHLFFTLFNGSRR